MNEEVMALYKQNGTQPRDAAACPCCSRCRCSSRSTRMLSVAIELRGAPFVGWINDLSSHDPLLRHADPDGRHHVRAAEDDAVGRPIRCRRR